jgi:Protein of unknwon function (DUF3310)
MTEPASLFLQINSVLPVPVGTSGLIESNLALIAGASGPWHGFQLRKSPDCAAFIVRAIVIDKINYGPDCGEWRALVKPAGASSHVEITVANNGREPMKFSGVLTFTAALHFGSVEHPAHYGGADNPYEVIKVLAAWGLEDRALLWNTVKYIARAGKKDPKKELEDLEKARFYLDREITNLKGKAP